MSKTQMTSTRSVAQRFGQRIRQLRQQQGFASQEALAEYANLHRTYIGRVERGETNITLENIMRLATALNVSLADLFEVFSEIEHE